MGSSGGSARSDSPELPARASTRSVLSFGGQVLAWLVILTIVATLVVAVLLPRLAGATPYTVLTGSMAPDLPPGTLVVAKPIDPEDVAVGDVLTIQLESGRAGFVTHRVTTIQHRLDGERRFRTQGDANDVPDADLRRPEQVRGKLWYAVPYLGHVNNALTGSQRQTAVYAVAAGLIAYAAYMFTGAVRGSRSRRGGESRS